MRLTRTLALFATLLGLATTAPAAEVKSMQVKFKSGDEEASAFVAMPTGKGPFPVIVVIQEWWGLNDWIKNNATRLAERGYVCIAPDLYRGKVTGVMKEASELLKGLPRDRAMRDLKGALDFVSALPEADKARIGAIGWCMGGGYAIDLSIADERVKACAICYGRVPTAPETVKSLKAKVLGIFGAEDRGIKADDVRKFEAALKEAGKSVEKIHLYPAGHGFMREKNGADKNPEYREAPAVDAWKQIDAFFAGALQK